MVLLPRRGHYATPENILKFRGLSIHDDPSQYSSKDAKKVAALVIVVIFKRAVDTFTHTKPFVNTNLSMNTE